MISDYKQLYWLVTGGPATIKLGLYTKDLTGQKFGRLAVIMPVDRCRVTGHVIWLCECQCTRACYVMSHKLTSGRVKSCGCLKVDENKKRLARSWYVNNFLL